MARRRPVADDDQDDYDDEYEERPRPRRRKRQGDATGGVIPYRNALALVAYYCAVFSLIPVLGAPLAVAAIVCGVFGMQQARRTPEVGGTVHAWIGIVGGGVVLASYLALAAFLILRGGKF